MSAIPWGIPDNRLTEYKFELESEINKMAEQDLTIQSQNVMDCLKFFIGYPAFFQNLIYEPLRVYKQNKDWVYSEINIKNWWWEKQKNFFIRAIIIPILITSDKTIINLSHKDQYGQFIL